MNKTAPAIAIEGLDHVVLRVRDMAKAIAFYTGVLGCPEERRLPDLGLVQLRAGRTLIDLVGLDSELGRRGGRGPGEEGRNLEHFCLRIARFDEAALTAYLASHGIKTEQAETRYGADGYGLSIYIADPDGNIVELKGPPHADQSRYR
ncbi:MAG TPA: VOC family protein [Alphaproteobacteria bacterium]|nr:VOC family protein [Alphaproteobacteria bacterium]